MQMSTLLRVFVLYGVWTGAPTFFPLRAEAELNPEDEDGIGEGADPVACCAGIVDIKVAKKLHESSCRERANGCDRGFDGLLPPVLASTPMAYLKTVLFGIVFRSDLNGMKILND